MTRIRPDTNGHQSVPPESGPTHSPSSRVEAREPSQVPFPWQDAENPGELIWRASANPIINRGHMAGVLGIFNSAVVPFQDSYAGVFRVEKKRRFPLLHTGFSEDGLDWQIDTEPLCFSSDVKDRPIHEYAYDPRVTKIDDTYYVTWCSGDEGPTIGIARTEDFRLFERLENAFLPFNRNGVLFPRRIGGHYWMLNRPSDNGHTPFGDIHISRSPDLTHWGMHRRVMGPTTIDEGIWWESTKIGAGPVPIETSEGWLLIYHGVMTTCNGFEYSMGAALLDLNEPWIVRYRAKDLLMAPETDYEIKGHVDNVLFPCAALQDEANGRLAIYYGAADTSTCVAYCEVDALLDWIKTSSSRC